MKIHLLTNFYNPPDKFRRSEIDACLMGNAEIEAISFIHVLKTAETEMPGESDKFIIVETKKDRITYKHLINYANAYIPEGDIAVIINSDILCTETISKLEKWVTPEQCVALTRWIPRSRPQQPKVMNERGVSDWRLLPINSSQDLWAFMVPLELDHEPNFCMGTPGCDNYIAWIIGQKHKLRNPAKSIITKHIHWSDERNYPPFIPGYKVRRVNIE